MINLEKKRKLVEELLSHIDTSEGGDLKKLIEQAKAPKDVEAFGKPKGVSVENVEVIGPEKEEEEAVSEEMPLEGQPGHEEAESPKMKAAEAALHKADDEELSEDELQELLKHYLG